MEPDRFRALIERIDHANSQDPNTELVDGVPTPRELAYVRRVSEWVLRLDPHASETLRIVARGQHICRWTIPRDRFPRTRAGYLRWRETLKAFHAEQVGELMRAAGYSQELIRRGRQIMSKSKLTTDPETQTLEDALCLVFLETQFADLRRKTPPDTMRTVLQKTWKKMSPKAREAALKLPLAREERALLEAALAD